MAATGRKVRLLFLCLCGGLLATSSLATDFQTRRVVLMVVDGPRATEFLEDPTHANVPRIWRDLRPAGYLSHAFYNLGVTWTDPGHATMLSGTFQEIPDDGSTRPSMPTLWEYYRAATGAPDSAVGFVTLKDKLLCMSYSSHPEFGGPDSGWAGGPFIDDESVVAAWLQRAESSAPVISGIFLGETDRVAHSCNWPAYIDCLRDADSLAAEVWDWIESTPGWAGQTSFFLTADHGRHTEVWCNHGDGCEGCRHLPFLALGPDFVAGVESWSPPGELRDLCRTIATLLDFPVPHAEGRLLYELLNVPAIAPMEVGRTGLRLAVHPVPATGVIRAVLPGALPGEWLATLLDPGGREIWRRRCSDAELRAGLGIPAPAGAGTTVAWLRVARPGGEQVTTRLVWIR